MRNLKRHVFGTIISKYIYISNRFLHTKVLDLTFPKKINIIITKRVANQRKSSFAARFLFYIMPLKSV